jgi:hypothetical protein
MRVAVLGCGPAGLMAAHAARVAGAEVHIFSRRRKSEMYGCQYLHAPIPGMTDVAPVEVTYHLHGNIEDYRHKVYGDTFDGTVSPEDLVGNHAAWDIRRTYDNMWMEYSRWITPVDVSPRWLQTSSSLHDHDLIINSIPRRAICHTQRHTFPAEQVWALGDAPERGIFAPRYTGNNQVVCNGFSEPPWYRASCVFGYSTVEWPSHGLPVTKAFDHAQVVWKPLDTDCDCWPEIMHVGRYGRWEKGVLSHTAYQQVIDRLVTEPVR